MEGRSTVRVVVVVMVNPVVMVMVIVNPVVDDATKVWFATGAATGVV